MTTALLIVLAARSVAALRIAGAWWPIAPAGVFGVLAADFATGCVHWLGDRFFREETAVIGRLLIQPFRQHHADPDAITTHGVRELLGNSCIPAIIVLAVVLAAGDNGGGALSAFRDVWLFTLITASVATNLFHKWAHARRTPILVAGLQRAGLILSPARHARHHQGAFDRSYCITSGILNPFLDRIEFFGKLERAIRSWHTVAR